MRKNYSFHFLQWILFKDTKGIFGSPVSKHRKFIKSYKGHGNSFIHHLFFIHAIKPEHSSLPSHAMDLRDIRDSVFHTHTTLLTKSQSPFRNKNYAKTAKFIKLLQRSSNHTRRSVRVGIYGTIVQRHLSAGRGTSREMTSPPAARALIERWTLLRRVDHFT